MTTECVVLDHVMPMTPGALMPLIWSLGSVDLETDHAHDTQCLDAPHLVLGISWFGNRLHFFIIHIPWVPQSIGWNGDWDDCPLLTIAPPPPPPGCPKWPMST